MHHVATIGPGRMIATARRVVEPLGRTRGSVASGRGSRPGTRDRVGLQAPVYAGSSAAAAPDRPTRHLAPSVAILEYDIIRPRDRPSRCRARAIVLCPLDDDPARHRRGLERHPRRAGRRRSPSRRVLPEMTRSLIRVQRRAKRRVRGEVGSQPASGKCLVKLLGILVAQLRRAREPSRMSPEGRAPGRPRAPRFGPVLITLRSPAPSRP